MVAPRLVRLSRSGGNRGAERGGCAVPQGGAVVIASLGIWSRLMIGYPRPKQKETRVTTADLLTKLFSRPDQKRPRQAFFTYLPYSTFRPRATRGQLAAQLQAPRVQRGLSDHPKTSNPSLMCCWPKVWWGAADSPGFLRGTITCHPRTISKGPSAIASSPNRATQIFALRCGVVVL